MTATSTATNTTSSTTAPKKVERVPQPIRPSQGHLKSTWHQPENKPTWKHQHWLFHLLNVDPIPPGTKAVIHKKDDPIPVWNNVQIHFWIALRYATAFAIQYGYTHFTGRNFHPVANALYWGFCISAFGANLINALRKIACKVGYLQPEASRDGIPDASVREVANSLLMTAFYRPMMATFLMYNRDGPMTLSPWLPLMIPAYSLATDFWFYWYHRFMHESDALWKYHRKHHTTKHPTPLLSLFADVEQEWWDVVIIPFLAFYTVKPIFNISYFDWMYCFWVVMFIEVTGHSGIRAAGSNPAFILFPMQRFDVDLVIEDHDNHHSRGWKKSGNYGKQTRVWDKLFGTVLERVEILEHLVDYSDKVTVPQF